MEQNNQFAQGPQINPVNLNPNPVSPEKKEKSILIPLIGAIVLTAVIVGGAMYWWMIQKEATLNIEIDNLENQVQANQIALSNEKTVVKVPLIDGSGGLKFSAEGASYSTEDISQAYESGELVGCGASLVYVSREVDKTSQPLNVAYEELFSMEATTTINGIELINSIAGETEERIGESFKDWSVDSLKPLKFIKAEIQNNTALVYLEGYIISAECGKPLVEAQIIFTAKQFPNITDVKTYLNGKEFNWKEWMNEKGATD